MHVIGSRLVLTQQSDRNVQQEGGGVVQLSPSLTICSRPDSILWQVVDSKVEKSAQFKSKKVGALIFGKLYALQNSIVLSISASHIVLVNIAKNRVLTYFTLMEESGGGGVIYHYWNSKSRTLMLLVRENDSTVTAQVYRVQTLRESLDDHAATFELKKAVKMVTKYAALHQGIGPIEFLLNQMFNKAKGQQVLQEDPKFFSASSDYKKFRHLVAKLETQGTAADKSSSAAVTATVAATDDDDDFGEAKSQDDDNY